MPRYTYECPMCKKEFEIDCKISEMNSTEPCPVCNTESKTVFKPGCGTYIAKCSGFYGKTSK